MGVGDGDVICVGIQILVRQAGFAPRWMVEHLELSS
jgi:hypothetical protein